MEALERLIASGFEVPGEPRPESRYFPATVRCPYPERWTATDGDSTELEVGEMVAGLVRAMQPDVVVETGAAFGITSQAIGIALAANGNGRLYALEQDELRAEVAKQACTGLPVTVIHGLSLEWVPPGPIGVVFLDTTFESRILELRYLMPHLTPGAIVVIHDTERELMLEPLEREFVRPGILAAVHLPTPRGVSICQLRDRGLEWRIGRLEQRLSDDDNELLKTVPR